jgi:hypothetical protein
VTLCVMQALLGFTSEARWLRYARAHLRAMFPYLPQQPGYNKRLRKLTATIGWLIGVLGRDTSLFSDDVWIADSTPVECGRSRDSARRSELAGFAEYGYCASHTRYFWGLGLHLLCTLGGLPVGAALTGAKADERQVLLDIRTDPTLAGHRPGQTLIADKNYYGRDFEAALTHTGVHLLRPACKGQPEHPGARFFKPLRQTIESISPEPDGADPDPPAPGCTPPTAPYRHPAPRPAPDTAAHRRPRPPRSPPSPTQPPTTGVPPRGTTGEAKSGPRARSNKTQP